MKEHDGILADVVGESRAGRDVEFDFPHRRRKPADDIPRSLFETRLRAVFDLRCLRVKAALSFDNLPGRTPTNEAVSFGKLAKAVEDRLNSTTSFERAFGKPSRRSTAR